MSVEVGIQVNDFFDFQELCREVDRHNGRRNDSLLSFSGRFVVPLNSGQLREMYNQMRRELSAYLASRRLGSSYVCLLAATIFIIGGFIVGTAISQENPYIGISVSLSAYAFGGMMIREDSRRDSRHQDRLLNSFNRVIAYANQRPDRSDIIQNWYSQFTMAAAIT